MLTTRVLSIVLAMLAILTLGEMTAVASTRRDFSSDAAFREYQARQGRGRSAASIANEGIERIAKLQVWADAIKRNPKDVVAYYQRGSYFMMEVRDSVSARLDFNRAIELDPGFAPAYFRRSYVHIAGKNFAKAQEDLETAVRLQPDVAQYAAQLAVFKFRIPDDRFYDPRQALSLATKACDLDPDENRCRLQAAILAELGQFSAAENVERKAVELAKNAGSDFSALYRERKMAPECEKLWQEMLAVPAPPTKK